MRKGEAELFLQLEKTKDMLVHNREKSNGILWRMLIEEGKKSWYHSRKCNGALKAWLSVPRSFSMCSRNLVVPEFARGFFVGGAWIFEAYAVRTLIKFRHLRRKISRKGRCIRDFESTSLICSRNFVVPGSAGAHRYAVIISQKSVLRPLFSCQIRCAMLQSLLFKRNMNSNPQSEQPERWKGQDYV